MIRGLVYSITSLCVLLFGSVLWMLLSGTSEDTLTVFAGWIFLFGLFLVGPAFFVLGYWHHRKLYPNDPHWDPETGE